MEIVDAAVQPMRLNVYALRFVRSKPNATNGNEWQTVIDFIEFCATLTLVFIFGVWFGANGARRG